jgi:hypothetical protein
MWKSEGVARRFKATQYVYIYIYIYNEFNLPENLVVEPQEK